MQVALFRALTSANVGQDETTAVVDQLGLHVESVVNNNIRAVEGRIAGVEAKLTAVQGKLEAKIDALDSKMTFLMAIVALLVGLGPIAAKLIR
jgi:hypothetical protein